MNKTGLIPVKTFVHREKGAPYIAIRWVKPQDLTSVVAKNHHHNDVNDTDGTIYKAIKKFGGEPDLIHEWAKDWEGSSSSRGAQAWRWVLDHYMAKDQKEADAHWSWDAEIITKQHQNPKDGLRYIAEHTSSPEARARLLNTVGIVAALSQAAYKGKKEVVLYRGVDGKQATEIRDQIKAGAKVIEYDTGSMSSFSEDKGTARGFGDLVVKVTIPVESIVATHKVLPELAGGEEEVLFASKGVLQIPLEDVTDHEGGDDYADEDDEKETAKTNKTAASICKKMGFNTPLFQHGHDSEAKYELDDITEELMRVWGEAEEIEPLEDIMRDTCFVGGGGGKAQKAFFWSVARQTAEAYELTPEFLKNTDAVKAVINGFGHANTKKFTDAAKGKLIPAMISAAIKERFSKIKNLDPAAAKEWLKPAVEFMVAADKMGIQKNIEWSQVFDAMRTGMTTTNALYKTAPPPEKKPEEKAEKKVKLSPLAQTAQKLREKHGLAGMHGIVKIRPENKAPKKGEEIVSLAAFAQKKSKRTDMPLPLLKSVTVLSVQEYTMKKCIDDTDLEKAGARLTWSQPPRDKIGQDSATAKIGGVTRYAISTAGEKGKYHLMHHTPGKFDKKVGIPHATSLGKFKTHDEARMAAENHFGTKGVKVYGTNKKPMKKSVPKSSPWSPDERKARKEREARYAAANPEAVKKPETVKKAGGSAVNVEKNPLKKPKWKPLGTEEKTKKSTDELLAERIAKGGFISEQSDRFDAPTKDHKVWKQDFAKAITGLVAKAVSDIRTVNAYGCGAHTGGIGITTNVESLNTRCTCDKPIRKSAVAERVAKAITAQDIETFRVARELGLPMDPAWVEKFLDDGDDIEVQA